MVPWSKENADENISDSPIPPPIEKKEKPKLPSESEKEKPEEQNGSITLNLGHYSAATLPICVLLFSVTCGILSTWNLVPDERITHLPMMFNIWPGLALCILYILFSVVWGPRIMKNRDAFKLRRSMMLYNIIQVVLCTYMFIEVGLIGWFFDYNYFCQPCDYSNNPKAIRMTKVAYLFFLSKILDFTDTIFFILHKKWAHISLLHVVHHSCMCMSMLMGIRYSAGGHVTFMGYINAFVHVVMYSYYLLAAMGPAIRPYLWWKKYLTRIQLIQFVAIFFHSAQLFFQDCPVPTGFAIWTCIYAFMFFGLFIDFYQKAYQNSAKQKARMLRNCYINGKVHSNGHVRNGSITNGYINGKIHSNGHINGTIHTNGHISNGTVHTNGVISNGTAHTNGVISNGTTHTNGVISNGTAHINGVISNGAVHSNGAVSNGIIHSNGIICNGNSENLNGSLNPITNSIDFTCLRERHTTVIE